jgi:ATP synthase protein I
MSGLMLALRVTGLGWYIAFCIVLGVIGGLWLDEKANTPPLFMLLGTLLGVVVAFYGMYKMVVPLLRYTERQGRDETED